jgi:type IV pilus assembly protein PilQ
VLGAATIAVWSIPAVAETVRVRTIRVSETAGDTAVVIAASARPTFTTWKLEQPARVVVEISGARLGDVNVPLDAGTYAVGLISGSVTEDESAGPRTRITLTLRQASDYRVESKGNEITLRVVPRTRPDVTAQANVEAKVAAEGKARLEAQTRAEQQTKAAEQAKAEAAASAEAKRQTEAQLRDEAKQRLAAEAKAEERARVAAAAEREVERLRQQLAEAQRMTDAAKAEERTRAAAAAEREVERLRQQLAEAQRMTDAARAEERSRSEAAARLEAERLRKELAQAQRMAAAARAEERSRSEAAAKLEADRVRDELAQRRVAQAKVEEHSRSEAAAKLEADRLRDELLRAQREAERARAEATAAAAESQRQRLALDQAEARARQAQAEADNARRRAELSEGRTAAALTHEKDRDRALRAATAEVENRQQTLDRTAARLQEQQRQLDKAGRLVGERETSVRASEAKLAEMDKEAREARARHEGLARDASAKHKAEAAAAMAEAERHRAEAAKAAERSRQELAEAVQARKQEEQRTQEQTQLRRTEEALLAEAMVLRKAEELRLAEARAERSRLDEERRRLEAEREQLERQRQTLLAEVSRLKAAAAAPAPVAAKPLPKPAPGKLAAAPTPEATKAAAAPPESKTTAAPATVSPPRSITLHAMSRVRAIDFIDEPSRASVIIDVDDRASFTVERTGGRRLSLRLEHSELPESLERNLDATEYLGPIKVISSYRDRVARGTVRIDVDLAEDVPQRVRWEGNRIFWDFQKAQGKAPSLPAVIAVPVQKVAGFVAVAKDGLWLGQAPPYLTPPGAANPPAAAPSAAPAAAPAAAGAAEGGKAGAAGGRQGLGKKRYVGRRIDLDFKGADIHNILRLLADVGQVNVIVADDVRGDVTIKMRDVPWDQALDVILRSKGLGSVREGNLLRVAPLPLLEKELEAEIARQKQIQDVLPTETRLIGVSYADASAMMDKAKDLITPRGKISVDQRTNTLIVSDVVRSLQLIEDLVRNLDTQTSQVVIEARIVEANSNFARQIGVQWGGTGYADTAHGNPTGLVFPYNVGIGGGADDGKAPLTGLVPYPRNGDGTTNPNFLVNMPASAGLNTGTAIGLTMGSVAGAFNLNLRLSAYENTGTIRILSSPRITTMDNIEANIDQGVSIPVSTVSAMGAQTQFVDAKLHLGVKPHVTNEGTIALVINVTRNEPDFANLGARGDPTIQKKEARTTMLVRDGDTAVIGGIYTRNTGLSNKRIPFFSDIPVLGWFFRTKSETDNRSEFMIFITPRIVNRARTVAQ